MVYCLKELKFGISRTWKGSVGYEQIRYDKIWCNEQRCTCKSGRDDQSFQAEWFPEQEGRRRDFMLRTSIGGQNK